MAYDSDKDKVLAIRTEEFGETNLDVKVVSYDGGPPKIQISRFRYAKDEPHDPKYLRVGRLTFDEARWVRTAIAELIQVAEEIDETATGEPTTDGSDDEESPSLSKVMGEVARQDDAEE